jgi:signal transduction histidine kinase
MTANVFAPIRKHRTRDYLLLPVLVLFLLKSAVCAAAPTFLTPQEISWLQDHPNIIVGPDPNAPPFEFLDSAGNYKGMSSEYLAQISKMLGITFTVAKAQNWAQVLTMAQEKKIDLVPAIVPSATRRKYLQFTSPWISVPGVVLSAQGCDTLEDLAGETVAVVTGSIWDDYITNNSVDVKLVRVEDTRMALEMASMSNVFATVTDMASATETINQLSIGNLHIILRIKENIDLSFGVRNDWPMLVTILNKTLLKMDPTLKDNIRHRWINLGDMHWWNDSSLVQTSLLVLGGLFTIILIFFIWNRTLRREVKKRSLALEQAHQSLIRAAKMESVGQLAAGVAHEVKNPLAIISMGVEFLSGNGTRDATEKEILTDMDEALYRADRVIRGLLDYSHYNTLERSQGDLNTVIRKALHLVNHEFKKRDIKVVTELALLKTAFFESTRIQQVLINLFMNSVQAMENGGVLEIVSSMHRLCADEVDLSDNYRIDMEVIKILVSDNGPGIHPHDSEKVFDPFYTTKDVGEGTGLGLSESRNIMELHNGTLHLANCKKTGACAVLILPCEKGEEHGSTENPAHR